MLKGKTVLLGITGSIAAYKIAYLASALHKLHADVHVLMTENATNFINPITFETLTGNKCLVDTFDRNFHFRGGTRIRGQEGRCCDWSHRLQCQCDRKAGTTALRTICSPLRYWPANARRSSAPAMNTAMYENPVVQDNYPERCKPTDMR